MIRTAPLVLAAFVTAGCGVFSSPSVRDLSQKEKDAFEAVEARIAENEEALEPFVDDLARLNAEYVEMGFALESDLAKAHRLEAMQAPWAGLGSSSPELQKTQKAVILYHLYEVEKAEWAVLGARAREREAAAREILDAYARLGRLSKQAIENLEIVIRYLEQPNDAKILASTSTLLDEVTAFRKQLVESENPRLQRLAEDVARYEQQARVIRDQLDRTLENLMRPGR